MNRIFEVTRSAECSTRQKELHDETTSVFFKKFLVSTPAAELVGMRLI